MERVAQVILPPYKALALSLVRGSWFVVAPLRGLPLGNGFKPARVSTGLIFNGVRGLGTALLIGVAGRLWPARRPAA